MASPAKVRKNIRGKRDSKMKTRREAAEKLRVKKCESLKLLRELEAKVSA